MSNILIGGKEAVKLLFSEADKFWYLEKGGKTSQPFFDRGAIITALCNKQIDWQE